jgi:3-phosphoshikimate 1-carboxyvinyltransferase
MKAWFRFQPNPIRAMQPLLQIAPVNHALHAVVRVPGSKSITNRALLVAALAPGRTVLSNALFSDDSRYCAGALRTLGFELQLDERRLEMAIIGLGGAIPSQRAELFVGNSGTTARFLTAFLTLGRGEFALDGEARMRERPIGDLISALTQLGATLEALDGCPPVKILASGLAGGKVSVAGEISSQFLSALLLVGPYARQSIEISMSTELNSKPYVDMTLAVMQDFGVGVKRNGYRSFSVMPARYRSPGTYTIESDASAASYFFAAAAVRGGSVRVEDISRHSRQGDIRFLEVLERMGCSVAEGADGIEVSGAPSLRGVDVDMRDIPDTAQTLAAIAPFADSPTTIRGIASARAKESNRIAATCAELRRLGVQVEEHPDGMTIHPCANVQPAVIQTYNDHRMAMAFALVGLRVPGVTIENPACVSKSFPSFFEVLETLR